MQTMGINDHWRYHFETHDIYMAALVITHFLWLSSLVNHQLTVPDSREMFFILEQCRRLGAKTVRG